MGPTIEIKRRNKKRIHSLLITGLILKQKTYTYVHLSAQFHSNGIVSAKIRMDLSAILEFMNVRTAVSVPCGHFVQERKVIVNGKFILIQHGSTLNIILKTSFQVRKQKKSINNVKLM